MRYRPPTEQSWGFYRFVAEHWPNLVRRLILLHARHHLLMSDFSTLQEHTNRIEAINTLKKAFRRA